MTGKITKAEKVLKEEINILQQISHPYIIKYIDNFETSSKLVCVLELGEGGTLQDFITKQINTNRSSTDGSEKDLSDEDASKIMKSVMEAVSYLHNQGIVHRDLKPENILLHDLKDLSDIRLIDFGLTARYNTSSPFGLLDSKGGTMLYMAPEVAMNQEYSKSIDMWSLGIILYNLLSGGGHPLHQKGESSEKFKAKLENKKKFYYDTSFSNLAIDLINSMTAYSPVYRYSIDQALKHPWITRTHDTKVPLTYFEMIEHADGHDKLGSVKF